MDNLRKFSVSAVFFLVASAGILFFAVGYPEYNGYESILNKDPSINATLQNLTNSLGNYQEESNLDVNISTADIPEIGAESLQLVSTVSTNRNQMSRITSSLNIVIQSVANSLGLSSGSFLALTGALISLIALILIALVWKSIRTGD
jgi:predicted PurR-regulated permease PerM